MMSPSPVLDELTTGLDPQARRDTWDLIAGIGDRGVTIVVPLGVAESRFKAEGPMSSPMPRSRLGPMEQLWPPTATVLPYVMLAFCIALMAVTKDPTRKTQVI